MRAALTPATNLVSTKVGLDKKQKEKARRANIIIGNENTEYTTNTSQVQPPPVEAIIKQFRVWSDLVDTRAPQKNDILGCDVSGAVVSVDSGVANYKINKIGDRAAGYGTKTETKENGAFAEYVRNGSEIALRLPRTCTLFSAQLGDTLEVPLATAAQGLYAHLALHMPSAGTSSNDRIFVWDGFCSVGIHFTQLARRSGLRVFVTASRGMHKYLKEHLGVGQCFNYRDEGMKAQVQAGSTEHGMKHGFDTISEGNTGAKVMDVIGKAGGNGVVTLGQKNLKKRRADIEVELD